MQSQSQLRHTWPQSSSAAAAAAAAASSSPAPVTRPRTIQFAGDILEDWLLFERNLCCYGPLTRAFIAEELDSLPDRGRCASSLSPSRASRGRGRVTFLQQGKEEHNVKGALKRRVRSPSPCPRVLRRRLGLISRSDSDSGVSMSMETDEDEDDDENTPLLQLSRMNAHSDALSASSISEEAIERWVSEHQERWFRDQLHQFDLRQRQLRSQSQPQAQVGGPVERERGRTGHIWSQSHYQVSGPRGRLGERERSGRGRGRMSSRREACWVVRGEDSE
jgi:hypothetical protein